MTESALEEVAAGVHLLRLPIPFELGSVNVYLFRRGSEVDIVDCGMNFPDSTDLIRGALGELGATGIRRLAITHIHPDHYGAAGVLTRELGAELYLHRLEIPMVQTRYVHPDALVETVGTYLEMNGVPADVAEELKSASMSLHTVVTPDLAAIALDGAETLQLGDRELFVLWTPGHSPGHICLFDRTDGLLVSGDHVLLGQSPNVGLHPQSTPDPLSEYMAGLRRIRDLPVTTVLPGHGVVFGSPNQRIDDLLHHHERRKTQMEGLMTGAGMTGWEVAQAVWGKREGPHENRLALQEGLAHLQSLAAEGRIRKRTGRSRITWEALPS